jgi:hypothetical protein
MGFDVDRHAAAPLFEWRAAALAAAGIIDMAKESRPRKRPGGTGGALAAW